MAKMAPIDYPPRQSLCQLQMMRQLKHSQTLYYSQLTVDSERQLGAAVYENLGMAYHEVHACATCHL